MENLKIWTDEEAAELAANTAKRVATQTRIRSVNYEQGQFTVAVETGATATFSASALAPLALADEAQRADFRVTASGNAVLWPTLGVGIGAESLVEAAFGLRQRMAA